MKVVGLVLIQNYFDFGFFRMVLNLDSFKSGFDCVKIVVFERKKTSEYSEFIRHRNVDLVQEIISLSLFIIYLFFCLFRAAPSAYGGSQDRGQIGAIAAGLCHSRSNSGSELPL